MEKNEYMLPTRAQITAAFEKKFEGAGLRLETYSIDDHVQLHEVAALDAEIFGEHKSLPFDAFLKIVENGGTVVGARNAEGRLVGEAAIVLEDNPDNGESEIECDMPEYLAYFDGTAVHPDFRGRGMQKDLFLLRESIAKDAGKEIVSGSIRHRNVASIRSLLRSGFVVTATAPNYYGAGQEHARVFATKVIETKNPLDKLRTDNPELDLEHMGVTRNDEVLGKIEGGTAVISLSVEQSDDVDPEFNAVMDALIDANYMLVAAHDLDMGDGDDDRTSAFVFIQNDTLHGEPFDRLKEVREDVRQRFSREPYPDAVKRTMPHNCSVGTGVWLAGG